MSNSNRQSEDQLQKLFGPIEVQLNNRPMEESQQIPKKQPPLKVRISTKDNFNKQEEFIPIESLSRTQMNENQIGHGQISRFQSNNPKIMICVTMYNEPQNQLKDTLDGILGNIQAFVEKVNIQTKDILVVVIYDGISKLNDSIDSSENMCSYFNRWDNYVNVKDNKRRLMQEEYRYYKEQENYQSLEIDKIKDIKYENLDPKSQNMYNQVKQELEEKNKKEQKEQGTNIEFTPSHKKIYEKLKKRKNKASEYIKYKSDKAQQLISSMGRILYQTKHILEKTQTGPIQDDYQGLYTDNNDALNVLHCVRYQNRGKLTSHLWFFCGFCELMNPEYTILLDGGVIVDKCAIYNMFLAFETDSNIGGLCGFIRIKVQNLYDEACNKIDEKVDLNIGWFSDIYHSIFDVQKAQQYEYNMGHFIDKPFESLFGYIQVLPGAFSGYRWKALKRNEETNDEILDEYLSSVLNSDQIITLEQQNMNQAEDRILCLKIFSRKNKSYKLRYLPNSKAWADPVTTFLALIGQRKRWINGSTFALWKCFKDRDKVNQSLHTFGGKFLFRTSLYCALLGDFLSYISVSVFYTIVFLMLSNMITTFTQSGFTNSEALQSLIQFVCQVSYFIAVGMLVFYSHTSTSGNPKTASVFYSLSTYFGVLLVISFIGMMYYVIMISIFTVNFYYLQRDEDIFGTSSIMETWEEGEMKKLFCYLVTGGFLINFIQHIMNPTKIREMITTVGHFIGFQSQYIHILVVYAFCRIDDLSWGTKGQSDDIQSSQAEASKKKKFSFVLSWILWNFCIGFVFSVLLTSDVLNSNDGFKSAKPIISLLIAIFFVGQLAFRIFLAFVYEVYFLYFRFLMHLKQKELKKLNSQQPPLSSVDNILKTGLDER